MIDINSENLVPLRNVPGKLPLQANGKRIHISAVYRWVLHGVGGVKLESIKLGGTTYTSDEAIQRFAEQRSGDRAAVPESPRARDLRAQRAHDAVQQLLFPERRQRDTG